ncbi:uncharacterized protein [Ptychodera flava]|uniref:uncharacterized protein n=1 Tax=Ptychodera flava TaxID=63121 RepID=UPI00396A0586
MSTMDPLRNCLSEITAICKSIDIESQSSMWEGVRECAEEIKAAVTCLNQVKVRKENIAKDVSGVKAKVKLVFKEQLNECGKLRNYGQQCTSIFQSLKDEIKFRHMDLEEFLQLCNLEEDYILLFEDDEIVKAMELFQVDFTSNAIRTLFKINMKEGDFKTLMNKIDSAEANHFYITDADRMESDLGRFGQESVKASKLVTKTLCDSLNETRATLGNVVKHLQKEKEATAVAGALLSAVGAAGLAFLTGGLSWVVYGVGLVGAIGAACDLKELSERMAKTKSTLFKWEGRLQDSIVQWQSLMIAFKALIALLQESGSKLKDEELHDMKCALSDTEKALKRSGRRAAHPPEGVPLCCKQIQERRTCYGLIVMFAILPLVKMAADLSQAYQLTKCNTQ